MIYHHWRWRRRRSNTVLQLSGGGLAYMVGQHIPCFGRQPCISVSEMWWLNVWVLVIVCPIYYVACNGRACDGCSISGIFKPEQPKPERPPPEDNSHTGQERGTRRCCQSCYKLTRDFTSAFRDPCFRWYWIYSLTVELSATVAGCLQFYWYQDCFPHGYYFFSIKVADTAVGQNIFETCHTATYLYGHLRPHLRCLHATGANAINAVIGQILHIGVVLRQTSQYFGRSLSSSVCFVSVRRYYAVGTPRLVA
jgi:hypothetical protein